MSVTPAPAEPPATVALSSRPTPDGERKRVTALYCELAEAPTLTVGLEPEVLYRWLQALAELAHEVMQHYDGTLRPPTSKG